MFPDLLISSGSLFHNQEPLHDTLLKQWKYDAYLF